MSGLHGITAYILAGGFGTRLRQVVPDRPKALAEILGRPYAYYLLDRLADQGLRRAVFCTGHMAEQLERELGPVYRGVELLYSREDAPLGTGGALALALSRHPAPLALVVNGDSLVDADLGAYADWFAGRAEEAALLLVPVPDAARFGRVSLEPSGAVAGFVEKGLGGPGDISAGIYLVRAGAMASVTPGRAASLETDVFPALASAGRLCALATRARFLDIGTPESYAEAGRFLLGPAASAEVEEGALAAAFLDRDGTLIVEKHYLHDPEGVELIPGVAEGLRRLRGLGLRLVLVSNQSGVGRGYFGRGDVERVHGRLIELLAGQGARLDAFYICPHAPDQDCACRKPAPGMVERACAELGLDAGASFVIGDKPCDLELAQATGARGILVRTGYGERHAAEMAARGLPVVRDLAGAADLIETLLR